MIDSRGERGGGLAVGDPGFKKRGALMASFQTGFTLKNVKFGPQKIAPPPNSRGGGGGGRAFVI